MPTTTAPVLALDVHICAQRRSYLATFTGPDADKIAAEFIKARYSTHAFNLEVEGQTEDTLDLADFPLVSDLLFPVCQHGLSAHLCAGPGHYPADL